MEQPKLRALVIDDETNLRASLVELVESEGFNSTQVGNGEEAVALLRAGTVVPDIIFLDLRMPKLDGLGVLKAIQAERLTDAPTIVLSAFGDSGHTIEAMRLGAYDYLTKPIELDELVTILSRAAEQRRLSLATRQTNSSDQSGGEALPDEMIGTSRPMREVFKQVGRLAATDATALILGESGVGKEVVARAIHRHSARATRPFIAVNCGAFPETLIEAELFGHERGAFTSAERQKKGRFELAHTGTIFLDEVGELTPAAQVKLLRVLQERRFERLGGTETIPLDVRILAATNQDLKRAISEKRFREDLFYRLSVVEMRLPPLRARLSDVPQLAEYFIDRATARHGRPAKTLSDAALRALLAYDYPGNVRELENTIERAVVTSGADVILPEHLFGVRPNVEVASEQSLQLLNLPFKEAVAALERELIRRALLAADGNRAKAARRLQINRRLLYDKLDEYKLS